MHFVTAIFSFLFYRVVFKVSFDTNISLISDIILSFLVLLIAGYINYVIGVSHGQKAAMKRLGLNKPSMPKARPLLMSIIAICLYSCVAFLIIYGFSDRLFDEVWEYSYRKKNKMRIVGFLIFSAPLILHYFILNWATNNALSRVTPANEE